MPNKSPHDSAEQHALWGKWPKRPSAEEPPAEQTPPADDAPATQEASAHDETTAQAVEKGPFATGALEQAMEGSSVPEATPSSDDAPRSAPEPTPRFDEPPAAGPFGAQAGEPVEPVAPGVIPSPNDDLPARAPSEAPFAAQAVEPEQPSEPAPADVTGAGIAAAALPGASDLEQNATPDVEPPHQQPSTSLSAAEQSVPAAAIALSMGKATAPPAEPSGVDTTGSGPTHAPLASAAALAGSVAMSTTGVPFYGPPGPAPELPGGGGAAPPDGAKPKRSRKQAAHFLGRGVRELAETVLLAVLIFLLVRAVVQNFQVEGKSMEPTLENGWYLLVNKSLYWEINLDSVHKLLPFVDPGQDPTRYIFRGPKRGDVIVFRAPEQNPGATERDFIKRIIGLPGDTVEVHDCTVFINGEPLDEPYILERPGYTVEPEVVPPGHFFVLGDNRNNSSDSHVWGMLPESNIIGQAWLTYWPLDIFGLIDNTHVKPGATNSNAQAPKPAGC